MLMNTHATVVLLGLTRLAAAGYFPNCNHDNCYRAFNGDDYAADALSYCSRFTTALTTNTKDFPSQATKACSDVAQISSVCSCAYPAPTVKRNTTTESTSKPPTTSSSATISLKCPTTTESPTRFTTSSLEPTNPTSKERTNLTISSVACFSPLQTSVIASHTCGTGTNCYRGLANIGPGGIPASDVVAFCGTYTTALNTGSTGIPARVLSSCGTTTTRISSLCSCLVSKQGSCAAAATSLPLSSPTRTGEPSSPSSLRSSISGLSQSTKSTSRAPTSTFKTAVVTAAPPEKPIVCNEDNCLRAFIRGNGSEFCSAYTRGGPDPPSYPTYTTQCTGSTISRISSACTCLNRPTEAPRLD